jgi:hypothetical protein
MRPFDETEAPIAKALHGIETKALHGIETEGRPSQGDALRVSAHDEKVRNILMGAKKGLIPNCHPRRERSQKAAVHPFERLGASGTWQSPSPGPSQQTRASVSTICVGLKKRGLRLS